MTDEPVIDGRDRDDLLEQLRSTAPYYVDDWEPERDDPGTVLFELFADMTEEVVERLDRVPEKQRAAFLDALDFEAAPPRPATVPVSFTVEESAPEAVTIAPRTTLASAATDDRDEQRFETDNDRPVQATPARLEAVRAIDPGLDRIVDHGPALLNEGEPTTLFAGENCQRHEYYLSHDELLELEPGSTLEISLETNAPPVVFQECLEWEYYGEDDDGEAGWQPLSVSVTESVGLSDPEWLPVAARATAEVEGELREHAPPGFELQREHPQYETLLRHVTHVVRSQQQDPIRGRTAGTDLPSTLVHDSDVDTETERTLKALLTGLSRRRTFDAELASETGTVTLSVEPSCSMAETAVDGVEAKWIRCRVPPNELAAPLFTLRVHDVRAAVGSEYQATDDGLEPDEAVVEDVQVDPTGDDPVRPFGRTPSPGAAFHLACEEVTSTPGAHAAINFEGGSPDDEATSPSSNGADADVVWEYWNGDGWRRLGVDDETDAFQTSGRVRFEVPGDVASKSVLGRELRWLRARLVEGNYGEFRVEEVGDGYERVDDDIDPPTYDRVTLEYERSDVPFQHEFRRNNQQFEAVGQRADDYRPFVPSPADDQAIYLGFDDQLAGGPIQLYFPIDEVLYTHEFDPQITAEYCSDPSEGAWRRVTLQDDTEDLTERGMVSLSFPEPTTEFELFGERRHWIRIRLVGEEFTPSSDGLLRRVGNNGSSTDQFRLSPRSIAEREQREQSRAAPELDGIHPNAVWACNSMAVGDEVLGSSTERANQSFEFGNVPVVEAEVWVEESETLSKRGQRRLEDGSTPVRTVTDADGSLEEFWVQWTEVSDFFTSTPSSRHYVLDGRSGTVRFGDGKHGAIPPAGENNVVADYEYGGGEAGNVPAGAIDRLETETAFLESVTNPDPGVNGEDREEKAEFVARAPKRLQDRNTPVTADGFERVARSAATGISTVACRAGEAETGRPGHVTLLVVPDADDQKPLPSQGLLKQVETEVSERAPEAIGGPGSLTVRGPTYVSVNVDATVEAPATSSATEVQEAAEAALTDFAHPVQGNTGVGWEIGSVPSPGAFGTCLESVTDVNRVSKLLVTYREGEESVTLAGGERAPDVAGDVLIYSGRHDVSVDLERTRQ